MKSIEGLATFHVS